MNVLVYEQQRRKGHLICPITESCLIKYFWVVFCGSTMLCVVLGWISIEQNYPSDENRQDFLFACSQPEIVWLSTKKTSRLIRSEGLFC